MLALRQNPTRKAVSEPVTIPAPVGGLNAKDSLADMPLEDAVRLDNIFPQPNYVQLRKGFSSHRTDVGSAIVVRTLMTYAKANGSDELLAVAGDTIYDVTSVGSAATVLSTSYTSADFQYANFSTTGGHFLIAVNGADTCIKYDGSSISTNTLSGTGLTATDLINVSSHKERLWFVENNSTNAWYLATEAITGALTKFPLGSVFHKGGELMATGTLSRDSGAGADDYWVAVSSSGEAVVYQGTDPSSASTWALVGVFQIGEPIGRRCLFNIGGDLIVITTAGCISMMKMMAVADVQQAFASITYKIQDLFNQASAYNGNFGWQGIVYPMGKWVLVNIPRVAGSDQFQYVMNGETGAWCKFTGLNANCWAVANGDIFFGGNDSTVYQADNTYQDDGAGITGTGITAFSSYGKKGRLKRFTAVRPLYYASGSVGFKIGINVDFNLDPPTGDASATADTGTTWDSALWDTGQWGGSDFVFKPWKGAGSIGTYGAVTFSVAINGQSCSVNAFDVVAQLGGIQ